MPNTTIGDYFTPSTLRSSKRQRAHISPGSPGDNEDNEMTDEKVGDMSLAQLMSGLSSLLETKLDEKLAKLATKEDLTGLNGKIQELVEENETLKKEINQLKHQGKTVYDKLIDLEGRSRRNNLIFKGLQWNGKRPDFREVIRNFCKEVLGMDRVWVNRAHPLGNNGKSVIAHIPEDTDIAYILTQAKTLRNTGYIIHRDFPHEIRVKRACLVAVRSEIDRVAGGLRMPLVHDHLYVKGKRFTWEAGKLRMGPFDGAQELKNMFRHDFTEHLAGLAERKSTGTRESPSQMSSQTYAQAVSQEAAKTPPEIQPAAQGTSPSTGPLPGVTQPTSAAATAQAVV